MPRVLRILNRLAVGGPVLNATYLTRHLQPEWETLLVAGEREDGEQSAQYLTDSLGIEVQTIKGMGRAVSPASDYKAYQSLKSLIKKFRPQVVHTHAAKPGALGRTAASAAGVPAVVHTFHGHVFHSYFGRAKTSFYLQTERWLARKTDAIVAISEQQKRELVQQFRIAPEHKFRLIRLGLDLDKFCQGKEEKRVRFRNEFGLQGDELAIGIVGRLVPVKNHALFIQALHHVMANSAQKVKAFIIGDGELRPQLEALATQRGIAFSGHRDDEHPHSLVFTSWRQDVDTVMAGLDVVALTSFNEGTPVSLIEAQAAGKPIVATRVGGIEDVVLEGETALLADINNPDLFASHLLQLISDKDLRHRMGRRGQFVLEQFGYQRMVREMSDLYHQLLDKKKANVFL